MIPEILVLFVLPALLALAAGWDIASYTIPNLLPLAVTAAFVVFALAVGLSGSGFGTHMAAGFVGLAAGFALFAAGVVGGGDAKLFAATAMWFGFTDLVTYVLAASVLGGGLTLALLMMRRLPMPQPLLRQPWLARLHDSRAGIPYGAALAAGALLALPHSELMHLAGIA